MLVNLALWAAGVALLAGGVMGVRVPLARYRELQATQANLDRYDSWRGGRRTAAPGGVTGADVMREQLRGRLMRWGLVVGAGVVLIVAGFVIR